MNIQIFGTNKSQETKKAQRFFKERGISFQFIDMKQKGMSRGELESVLRALGGLEGILDHDAKDRGPVALLLHTVPEDQLETLLKNQGAIRLPVVRNGKQATAGYMPDVWKSWS